jgi:hypothetical protein
MFPVQTLGAKWTTLWSSLRRLLLLALVQLAVYRKLPPVATASAVLLLASALCFEASFL